MKKTFYFSSLLLFAGIISILIGLGSLVYSKFTFPLLLKVVGISVSLVGVVSLILNLVKKADIQKYRTMHVVGAIFNILFGFVLFFYAGELANIFIVVCGIVIVIGSILLIFSNFSYYVRTKVSMAYLIISVLLLICGIVFIFNPDFINAIIDVVFGVLSLLLGILFVLMSIKIRKVVKDYNKKLELEGENVSAVDAEIIEDEKEEIK